MRVKIDNVEKIVSDAAGELLLKKGYNQIEEVVADISKMKVDELKALAEEKGIEGAKSMKKEDLLEALKDVVE